MTDFARDGTAFDVTGPAEAPVVVLIHGLGLNRGLWRDFVPALARRYRVLSYDLIGHGDSPRAEREPRLATFSAQLLGLLDELGADAFSIVGFSLGGMINRRFAIDHPARLRSLVILNSPHERSPESQRQVEERALDSAAGGPGATLDAAIARWFTPEYIAAHPADIETVRAWVLVNDAESYAFCRRTLAFGVIELIRPEPPLALPALIVTSADDSGSTPAMSAAIGAEIAGSEVRIVPRLKHMGLFEEPALFLAPIGEFLERLDPR